MERTRRAYELDVDDFDRLNRILGYEEADTVISDIAAELREARLELGAADDADLATIYRFGGEEFAAIMPHEVLGPEAVSRAEPAALRLAERMRNRVRLVSRGDLRATVSVGIATFPEDGTSLEDLLEAADRALASAFADGGDRAISATAVAAGAVEDAAAVAPLDTGGSQE